MAIIDELLYLTVRDAQLGSDLLDGVGRERLATLAQHLGVRRIIGSRVDLSGRVGGASTGIKAMTVLWSAADGRGVDRRRRCAARGRERGRAGP